MQLEEQYRLINVLKEEVNKRLQEELSFSRIKELILWMAKSTEFQRVYKKDKGLRVFKFFTDIWIDEKKEMDSFEMQGDIFAGVHSLDDIEIKLKTAKYLFFRIENNVPYELCIDLIEQVVSYRFSPYALYRIIEETTEESSETLFKLTELFKGRNDLIRAIGLLQCAEKNYESKNQIYISMADCWLMAQEYGKAYKCLCRIEKPNSEIQELKKELEKVANNEGLQ